MTVRTGDYFDYVTVAGDRWDLLAYRFYGDQHRQTVLVEANRGLFLDGLSIPPAILPRGLRLRVPVVEDAPANAAQLPPWKRDRPVY